MVRSGTSLTARHDVRDKSPRATCLRRNASDYSRSQARVTVTRWRSHTSLIDRNQQSAGKSGATRTCGNILRSGSATLSGKDRNTPGNNGARATRSDIESSACRKGAGVRSRLQSLAGAWQGRSKTLKSISTAAQANRSQDTHTAGVATQGCERDTAE